MAAEAERRGFTVTSPAEGNTTGRHSVLVWHVLLIGSGETVPLRISEEDDRVEHVATPRELREQRSNPWARIPKHDRVPSGRLRIDMGGPIQSDRKSFWADRTSWTLEDKLPELLREVAVRVDELRLRREAKIRAEERYRRALEEERERARLRAGETHRSKVLEEQLGRWREVRELREFAADVAQQIDHAEFVGEASEEEIVQARRWLAWINERADKTDPLRQLPSWPETRELGSWELNRFMKHVPEPLEMRYQPESY
ncbi:hypothetical protein [Actinopolyspora mortivallis]|uniref:hypothetical protein n=1 Tax=Actinopolyspora mortivallis TaxID=33906 RepID=UPI0011B1D73B|nr:hypothetical protein [Actinopolyspora mortivallis]